MYFVNWQREVSLRELDGQKVVIKHNKRTKEFHEFLLIYMYTLISIILAHPSMPPRFSEIMKNEGREMRSNLKKIGVSTPELISISDIDLVEEYIEGGDLYVAFASDLPVGLAFAAGSLTGRMHKAGLTFVDNKAQNYLVRGDSVVRTDLGFIQKSGSSYARSMDIGSFLASIMDLSKYREIEQSFLDGYLSEFGCKFSFVAIIIRNILSLGFSSNSKMTFKNMALDTTMILED